MCVCPKGMCVYVYIYTQGEYHIDMHQIHGFPSLLKLVCKCWMVLLIFVPWLCMVPETAQRPQFEGMIRAAPPFGEFGRCAQAEVMATKKAQP